VLDPESLPEISLESVISSIAGRKHWIDGVTITGGEPTLNKKLPGLLKLIKHNGFQVKLDTNGSNPDVVSKLIKDRLIDAIAMDVKAPLTTEEYSRVAGVTVNIERIQESIRLLKSSGLEVTFRTTAIPGLVEEPQLKRIREALGDVQKYTIQGFRNQDTLEPSFAEITEFSANRLDTMRQLFEVPAPDMARIRRYAATG
jgi:pyruvate formate lyase activating enzyme